MNRRTIVMIVVGAMLVIAAPAAIAQLQELSAGVSQGSGLTQYHEYIHVQASVRERDVQQAAAANCVDGTAGEFACDNVDMLSHVPALDLGFTFVNDIWGWTDPDDGAEYAIMGGAEGTAFVDISDPRDPIHVAFLDTQSTAGGDFWRDIKVHADHAYVVSENSNHGMQVFDLTQLGDIDAEDMPANLPATAVYTGTAEQTVSNTHNLHINTDTGFAYLIGTSTCGNGSGSNGGLHMVDLADPADPEFAGCAGDMGYVHDTQCVVYDGPDAAHTGKEICFNSNAVERAIGRLNTLSITDVTDKDNPVMLANVEYDADGYSHQGWLTDDMAYFLHGDELDEDGGAVDETTTRIWDVSDLDDPQVIGVEALGTTSIDHNMYVEGRYMTQSNYTTGLRVQDLVDVADGELSEAAFFDMYPQNDAPTFEGGTWSNFPYYEQPGIVAVSSIDRGLFILRPMVADAGGPYAVPNGGTVDLDATGSMDADNPDMDFDWDLDGDGEFDDATGAQPTFDATGLADESVLVAVRISYDGSVDVDEAQVIVGDAPVNVPPTATDDDYTTGVDVELVVDAPGVLDNDSDGDGDDLTAVLEDDVTDGTLVLDADGGFTYTPNAGFTGVDTFTYVADDGTATSAPATVTITVADAPDLGESFEPDTGWETTWTIQNNSSPIGVNDWFQGNSTVFTSHEGAPEGYAGANYNSAAGLGTIDSWLISPLIDDLSTGDAYSFWTRTVAASAFPDRMEFRLSTAGSCTPGAAVGEIGDFDTLLQAINPDQQVGGYPEVWTEFSDILEDVPDGASGCFAFRYTVTQAGPDGTRSNYIGVDTFAYDAADPVNTAPVTADDDYSTTEDEVLEVDAPGVLANDSDADGDALTATLAADADNGAVELQPDGSFTYTPAAGFTGTDTFTYEASDGTDVDTATVTISVTEEGTPPPPANEAPTAADDAYSTSADTALQVDAPGVLANDTDPDDDGLAAQLVSEAGSGVVDLQPDGSFTYTPNDGFAGEDTFTYVADDGEDSSAPATVTIAVEPVLLPAEELGEADDNVERAIAWSQLTIPDPGDDSTFDRASASFAQDGERVVLLGRDDGFADSLSSGGAQGVLQAPLLLTGTDGLDDAVAEELQRLGADRVIILGGVLALSEQVETDLEALDVEVERLEGETRLETAVAVAERITPSSVTTAVIARSHPAVGGGEATQAFADSLAAGALAAERDLPLVLTQTEGLSDTTARWLTEAGITEVLVVGGEAAVSMDVVDDLEALDIAVTRIGAGSRAGTAVAIAAERGAATAGLADGSILIHGEDPDAWADAFPATLLASRSLTPIVLTSGDVMPPETEGYLAGGGTPLICGTLTSSTACDIAVGLLEGAAG